MSRIRKALLAISGGHFLVEWYAAFLPPLIPVFRTRLGFSLGAAAALGASLPIVSGLVQTIFGLLSDRMRRANALVVTSSILAAVSLALLPFARSFGWLLLIFIIIALSLAMFHPQGAAGMSQLFSTNKGRFMSIFNFGGSMGSFVGSLTVIPLFGLLHLERFWILAIPGIALAFFQVFALPRQENPTIAARNGNGGRMTDNPAFKGYLMLFANSTLNAMVYNGVTVLLPLLFQGLGFQPGKAGIYLAVGSLVGAVANVIGAELSDHIGRRAINIIGATGVAVTLLMFVLTGSTSIVWFPAMCFFSCFTLSSNIVFAHELVTNHRGLISASIMGLSWGIGGLVVIILGQWAQHTSITSAYRLLLGVAAALVMLAFLLPTRQAIRTALEHVPAQKQA
ncbi:MFS transporter [Candidatus Cryosericum hinesii]|uniref:MFS transporter n=1 Tax=Candidatus Cryosericum hinesii TaxID=2290915 RepID=A0ABX9MBY2_9BACT|nr:MFS transporter [Candidatus Cryosericum hinesii]RIE11519.1 MFS transporter [Candidatus Cryosericum hinesii]